MQSTLPSQQELEKIEAGPYLPLMAMVEITGKCNMACPVCFAGATGDGEDVPLEQVQQRIDKLVNTVGNIPLQISGGEPTLHEDLEDIVGYAYKKGFRNIELVTNGILISQEKSLLKRLAEKGLSAVYLQFDGLSEESHLAIRGQDMRKTRKDAVAAIRSARLCCTLAVAVTRGVNDSELGDIVRFGLENIDTVRAINFQAAVRFSGRFKVNSQERGYTLDELISRIEQQAGLRPGGFARDLLGHQQCNAISLVYTIGEKLEPLFCFLSRKSLEMFLGDDRRQTIFDLFAGKKKFIHKHLLQPASWRLLAEAATIFGKKPNIKSIYEAKHLLLFAKSFMEAEDISAKRLQQCVYAMATDEGPLSFCAYNHLHRSTAQKKVFLKE